MSFNRNKLYSLMLIACLVGYIWLYFSITKIITFWEDNHGDKTVHPWARSTIRFASLANSIV